MLNSSLANLLNLNLINLPGLCSVVAVPKEGVESMPDVKTLMRTAASETNFDFFLEEIVLKDGYEWLNITTDFRANTELVEKENRTGQGKEFTYQLPFVIPNDVYVTRGKVIRAYDNREFIVVFKERTGAIRVLGSLERGCFFQAELSTGKTKKGPNAHECGFTWEVGGQRPFYVNEFPTDNYFEVTGIINDMAVDVFIGINETVLIVWGDGTQEIAYGALLANNLISHQYADGISATPYTFRVYHRNLATLLDVHGIAQYNGTINALSGPIANPFPPVTDVDASGNFLDDADLFAILGALVTGGLLNGTVDLSNQTPAVIPGGFTLAAKAALEANGWTVTL